MYLVHLPNAFGTIIENMAVDSTLLQSVPSKHALFRHYGWIQPSISFGYTQRYEEVRQLTQPEVHIGRRPTAGGIVDHRNDWTYSLILQSELPAANRTLAETYTSIHRCMQCALQAIDIESHLAPCPKQCTDQSGPLENSPHCFTKPVADDLIHPTTKAKIAGAAIKRNRNGILLQGSIDRSALPPCFSDSLFAEHFTQAIGKALNLTIQQLPDLRPLFQQPLLDDTRKLYADNRWQQKR
ncbi:MAG: lipoyl protein ligase domain-containing protein [Coraliomargaritaceae bacterium]